LLRKTWASVRQGKKLFPANKRTHTKGSWPAWLTDSWRRFSFREIILLPRLPRRRGRGSGFAARPREFASARMRPLSSRARPAQAWTASEFNLEASDPLLRSRPPSYPLLVRPGVGRRQLRRIFPADGDIYVADLQSPTKKSGSYRGHMFILIVRPTEVKPKTKPSSQTKSCPPGSEQKRFCRRSIPADTCTNAGKIRVRRPRRGGFKTRVRRRRPGFRRLVAVRTRLRRDNPAANYVLKI